LDLSRSNSESIKVNFAWHDSGVSKRGG